MTNINRQASAPQRTHTTQNTSTRFSEHSPIVQYATATYLQAQKPEEPKEPVTLGKRPRTGEETEKTAEIIAQGAGDWFRALQGEANKRARGTTPEDAWEVAGQAAKEQTSEKTIGIAYWRNQEAIQTTRQEKLGLIVDKFSTLSDQEREARSTQF